MQNSGPPISPISDPGQSPLPLSSQADQSRSKRTWSAVLTLYFLAALIPESIATYNSSPLQLITHPSTLLFITAFYGSVALLVRELMHRRTLGWASILLLGMAAGSINEGIIAGTWYKVQYTGYSMINGMDPAVAVGLTVFHTLYSTVLPILLVETIFPRTATRSWLGRKGMLAFLLVLIFTTLIGFAPAADRNMKVVVLLGVLVLVATALVLPRGRMRPISMKRVPGLGRLRLMGALGTFLFFTIFAVIPGIVGSRVPPGLLPGWQIVFITLMGILFGIAIASGRSWSRRAGWGQRQTLAVITGALLPMIILSVVIPVALKGLEPIVTVPMLLLLIWLAWRTKRRERESATVS